MLHTIRYLKPVQVYGRMYRRKPVRTVAASTPQTRVSTGVWAPAIPRECARTAPERFRFLNQERRIETWNDSGVPKLWLYNLHYFESPAADLIQRWILENPTGHGNGWEPYPLSLRICNWIKWSFSGNPLENAALESLSVQARYLARNIEYHLLGNHVFANAKALVYAGAFFDGNVAAECLASGLQLLTAQLREQLLEDGGHFERTPMYHSLILEDVLDLINLGWTYPSLLPDLTDTAQHMLGWLAKMTHPDGGIAFFNDAAFGVAPTPAALLGYASRLGIKSHPTPLGESGYIRLENGRAVVLFDAAAIGPDYQPGHAHADTLSFELSVDGCRAIVHSGISTYENNAERHRQRSTAAHNTIRVDGQDSTEVWAAFRVARRARPLNVKTDRRTFAEAGHNGYARLKDPVIHTRRLDLEESGLRITDTLQGKLEHQAELYFHLYPQSEIKIQLDPKLNRSDETTSWYPEFNKRVPNKTVIGRWFGRCPVQFVTQIAFA